MNKWIKRSAGAATVAGAFFVGVAAGGTVTPVEVARQGTATESPHPAVAGTPAPTVTVTAAPKAVNKTPAICATALATGTATLDAAGDGFFLMADMLQAIQDMDFDKVDQLLVESDASAEKIGQLRSKFDAESAQCLAQQ